MAGDTGDAADFLLLVGEHEGDADTAAALSAAAEFRLARHELQRAQAARLAERLPLPQVVLPFVFSAAIGRAEVAALADVAMAGIAALPPASR